MALKTTSFDAAEHITAPDDQMALLNDALASNDAAYISNALGVIARAQGMTKVARGAGVTREALYKSLNKTGDPKLTTVIGVLRTLNYRIAALPSPAVKGLRQSKGIAKVGGKAAHARDTKTTDRPTQRASRAASKYDRP